MRRCVSQPGIVTHSQPAAAACQKGCVRFVLRGQGARMLTAVFRRPAKGFSLLEIIIAVAILGMSLVTMLAYLPVALDAAKQGHDISTAGMMARHQLERVRSSGFSDIRDADALATAGLFVDDPLFPGFQYSIEVLPSGAAEIKEVRVRVRWRVRGAWVEKTFETAIVKYNP